jgi:hypothetical protein
MFDFGSFPTNRNQTQTRRSPPNYYTYHNLQLQILNVIITLLGPCNDTQNTNDPNFIAKAKKLFLNHCTAYKTCPRELSLKHHSPIWQSISDMYPTPMHVGYALGKYVTDKFYLFLERGRYFWDAAEWH